MVTRLIICRHCKTKHRFDIAETDLPETCSSCGESFRKSIDERLPLIFQWHWINRSVTRIVFQTDFFGGCLMLLLFVGLNVIFAMEDLSIFWNVSLTAFPLYVIAALLINKNILVITDETISVRQGPLPWPSVNCPVASIGDVFARHELEERIYRSGEGGERRKNVFVSGLYLRLKDGTTRKLFETKDKEFSEVNDVDGEIFGELRHVARSIESYLKLKKLVRCTRCRRVFKVKPEPAVKKFVCKQCSKARRESSSK